MFDAFELDFPAFSTYQIPVFNSILTFIPFHFYVFLQILQRDDSFINLVAIKMNCTLGTTNNLLENLSTNVANQLRELWITTPINFVEDNEKRLSAVINRFPSLNVLHLIVPGNYLDSQTLFPHCRNVSELSILSEDEDQMIKNTLKHIQMHCTDLQTLHVYHYDDSVPVDVLKIALDLCPNVVLKSNQIDPYGALTMEHTVNMEWLDQMSKSQ